MADTNHIWPDWQEVLRLRQRDEWATFIETYLAEVMDGDTQTGVHRTMLDTLKEEYAQVPTDDV